MGETLAVATALTVALGVLLVLAAVGWALGTLVGKALFWGYTAMGFSDPRPLMALIAVACGVATYFLQSAF